MSRKVSFCKERYNINKACKVGETIICPICHTAFIKKQYSQAFCCTQCKDKFWNSKGDRHSDPNYYRNYNMRHPERLMRIGIDIDNDIECAAFCDNPQLGI